MSEECLFCRIVSRDVPASVVYEDEELLAFEDINPQAPVHVLVIPKEHVSTLNDLAEENTAIIGRMASTARRIATERGYAEEGYRLVINCNRSGGQLIFHIHMHVLAGRLLRWPPG